MPMPSSLDPDLRPAGESGDLPNESALPPIVSPNWAPLVARIQDGDQQAMAELYKTFSRGIRYYLCRHLGSQELEDKVHDTYLIVVQAIQRGELRDPEKLMGFVRTVVRRQVAAHIDAAVHYRKEMADLEVGARVADNRSNPEQVAIREERTKLMMRVLRGISDRDREILTRFYLYEQPQEQICEEMGLTETQFRLLKSRAKARFGELGKRRITSGLKQIFLRKTAAAAH
jgi:RNA polymerase sigma-70 factor (ECF subfamily)